MALAAANAPIRRFELVGLYADRTLIVEFEGPAKILIGENGSGKTTLLRTLHSVLTGDWFRLASLQFSEIRIAFATESIEIPKELLSAETEPSSGFFQHLTAQLPRAEVVRLWNASRSMTPSEFEHRFERLTKKIGIPAEIVFLELRSSYRGADRESKILTGIANKVKDLFPYPTLYFPTYRRVEEDISELGYITKAEVGPAAPAEQLIQFGMHDVKTRLDQITSAITTSSVEWFSIINGKILGQLISGIEGQTVAYDRIQNLDAFRIVLDRIGENISKENKEHILELIVSESIKQDQYKPLAYFLSNLIEVYDRQRDNDNAIKTFARISNEYLGDKEIRYNESRVDIQVVNKRTGKSVELNRLSSGEKQVVSMLSRLYLGSKAEPYAIIIDEPELSLSIEWQKRLLPDMMQSGRCAFLLAATHSPFIFENELDRYASTLIVQEFNP